MIPKFQKYLKDIGVTKPIRDRVEHFYCLCRDMHFGKLFDIFIDDYLTEDGTRKYEGLSFLSNYFSFGIPNFLTDDKIHVAIYQAWYDRVAIKVDNYDFKKANDKSLMIVQMSIKNDSSGSYKAAQNNCEYLVQILKKYVRPTLMKREIKISSIG